MKCPYKSNNGIGIECEEIECVAYSSKFQFCILVLIAIQQLSSGDLTELERVKINIK